MNSAKKRQTARASPHPFVPTNLADGNPLDFGVVLSKTAFDHNLRH